MEKNQCRNLLQTYFQAIVVTLSQGNELFLTKLLVSWSYKEKQNALFELEVLSGIEATPSPKGGEMKDPRNGSQATHSNNLKGIITWLKTLLCFKS